MSRRGFSLLETVVAIAIVAVIGVACSIAVERIIVAGRETGQRNLALKIALNEIEQLRGFGYDVLPATGFFNDPLLSRLPQGTGTVTVSTYSAKVKQVVVGVTWRGSLGQRLVSLTSLIAQSSTFK